MDIVKHLQSAKTGLLNADKSNEIISDVKYLLDSDSSEDLRISNALGKHHSLAIAQTKIGMQIELNELDEKYVGNVFKVEDIKHICIKYHMRFLQSKLFAGHLDISAIHKIKEFSKQTGVDLNDATIHYGFYVLAPDESFKLKSERMPRKSDDPAIFYKINETHYRLIHKWGVDFTPLRLWKGLMWKSLIIRFWLVAVAATLAIGAIIFSLGINYYWMFLCALGFAFSAIYNRKFWDMSYPDNLFTPKKWNQETRLY